MKRIIITGLSLMVFSILSSAQGKDLSVDDFYAATKNNNRIQLIDVRTPGEFNSGHLPNAENIDFYDRKFLEEVSTLNQNKATYLYCASGNRSGKAMKALSEAGFKKVYNLSGGIQAWEDAELPTSNSAISTTKLKDLNMSQFKKLVSGNTPVLVDFTATWCGPCKILKPRVKQLAKKKGDDLKVIYLDIDKNKSLADELGIRAIPLLHYYENGKLKRKSTGLISAYELKQLVR